MRQKFDFQYAQQQEFIIQLQQSITQQQQTNAQLLSGINSVVLPMQKIHRRVLLHYLQGIINSPDQMSVLVNVDADVLLFRYD